MLEDSTTKTARPTGNKTWTVVNPYQFEVIRKSVKKTDKNDSKTLALFLSKDMLPEARMKTKENAQLYSLDGTRDKLVKLRTALINKVHNVLNRYGIKFKKESLGSEKGLKSVWAYDWDVIVRIELEVLVEQIRSLNKSIKTLDKEMTDHGQKLKGQKRKKEPKSLILNYGWRCRVNRQIIEDTMNVDTKKSIVRSFIQNREV